MYEIEYNKKERLWGVYRSSPYMSKRMLCAVYDRLEDAVDYIVRTLNKKTDNWPYDTI